MVQERSSSVPISQNAAFHSRMGSISQSRFSFESGEISSVLVRFELNSITRN